MRRVLGVLVLVSVLGVVFAGCGGGSEGEGSAPGSSPAPPPSSMVESTSTTTQSSSDEEAILASVQGYWRAILRANDPPDPEHPDLERYATGDALERAVANVKERRSLNRVIRLPAESQYRHMAQVETIVGDRATVIDCGVDDTLVIDVPSGVVLNNAVETTRWRTELVRVDDTWKVARNSVLEAWRGVDGCAL
ncbi:hypothetical protein [Rhabdothermincola sediminis]|uniref:hypothetical protein n=1 Tax=Rhabdothermincola sediminis TaxID=2751370 RepID=UPI001AA073A4|nr:hypothetical protein [Rhabdothermincola sediminis]